MSQNSIEPGYFINLLNPNPSYQQETGSNPSTPSSQHSISSSSFQQYPGFAQQPNGRKFQLEHAWRILKGHSKWDAPKPFDTEDHTEIFGPDARPRPAGKTRPAKKIKSETTGSSRGSASGSISDFASEDLRRKLQAGTSAYEAKKQKELAMMEFKEMEFLTIDADKLPEPKASIIRRRQEKIIAKYAQE
ncbi:hypothetical protein Tco_0046464 [Tanacetum coccineum]